MHTNALDLKTRNGLAVLTPHNWLKQFYLAGGTAVALHLGHRVSHDLDFFSPQEVDPKILRNQLSPLGKLVIDVEREGTLWVTLNNVKMSFIHYPYPLVDTTQSYEGVTIVGIKDLACMKLDTISSRGSKRDFIDFYFMLQTGHRIEDVLKWFTQKYQGISYNQGHLLKSLTYFEDAEAEKEPAMLSPFSWPDLKRFFVRECERLVKAN